MMILEVTRSDFHFLLPKTCATKSKITSLALYACISFIYYTFFGIMLIQPAIFLCKRQKLVKPFEPFLREVPLVHYLLLLLNQFSISCSSSLYLEGRRWFFSIKAIIWSYCACHLSSCVIFSFVCS